MTHTVVASRNFLAGVVARAGQRLAAVVQAARRRRAVLLAALLLPVALFLVPAVWMIHHVYFDRAGVPDLEAFIRFEPPTTGVVRDARGNVLIQLAREYRRVVTYPRDLRVYEQEFVGQAPRFPREIEDGISRYLAMQAAPADLPEVLSDPGEREDTVSRGRRASPRRLPGG